MFVTSYQINMANSKVSLGLLAESIFLEDYICKHSVMLQDNYLDSDSAGKVTNTTETVHEEVLVNDFLVIRQ